MQIDLVVLVLKLPEMFEVDPSGVQYLLALRVDVHDLLVLFKFLACLYILLAVLIREIDGDDLGLSLRDLLEHELSLLYGIQGGQGLVEEGFRFVREGRVGVSAWAEFGFGCRPGEQGTFLWDKRLVLRLGGRWRVWGGGLGEGGETTKEEKGFMVHKFR